MLVQIKNLLHHFHTFFKKKKNKLIQKSTKKHISFQIDISVNVQLKKKIKKQYYFLLVEKENFYR